MLIDYKCPHCGSEQYCYADPRAKIETACSTCMGSLRVETGMFSVKSLTKGEPPQTIKPDKQTVAKQQSNQTIYIGNFFGNASFGNDSIMNIYDQTIEIIEGAKDIGEEQRTQAKGILEYVKNNAAPFMPVIAEVVKKALGL